MALIYVTGIPGSGKSSVCHELRAQGFDAHDTDEEGTATFVNRLTGETRATARAAERTAEFRATYDWRLNIGKVERLADLAGARLSFLCGSAGNEVDAWHLFDQAIYLAIDDLTLRHRLATRTVNDFGKTSHELQRCLDWLTVADEEYSALGAVPIDATAPLEDVVRAVIEVANRSI